MEKHDSNRLENSGSWNTNHNQTIPSIFLQHSELLIQVGGFMIVSIEGTPLHFQFQWKGSSFPYFFFVFQILVVVVCLSQQSKLQSLIQRKGILNEKKRKERNGNLGYDDAPDNGCKSITTHWTRLLSQKITNPNIKYFQISIWFPVYITICPISS